MKSLVAAAVVGLGRAGEPPGEDPPLVTLLDSLEKERALLLRLGVASTQARAGQRAGRALRPSSQALPDQRPVCSDALAAIVIDLGQTGNTTLMTEALTRMDERGRRLPPAFLVDFAELHAPSLQPLASRVAGERGRWLATLNPEWLWLLGGDAACPTSERLHAWQEGDQPIRLAALRATRTADPAEGRAWLEAAWKTLPREHRPALVEVLVTRLSPEDVPFLERVLKDRALPVRAAAAALLAKLDTALRARMVARADAMITDRLLTLPASFDDAWEHDGIIEKPPKNVEAPWHWATQIFALVPPEHWTRRFDATPAGLLASASAPLQALWMAAAVAFNATPWMQAVVADHPEFGLYLGAGEREERALQSLAPGARNQTALAFAPRPWSERLGNAFLEALSTRPDEWLASLPLAATALPGPCLPAAIALSSIQGDAKIRIAREVLTVRQRIHEETRP